jgi:DNA-nicking Smr family endonuclease
MTRRGRDLTDAEKALWNRITQTIDPLNKEKDRKEGNPPSPSLPLHSSPRPRSRIVLEPQAPLSSRSHPPLTHRLKRMQKVKIEARLDLHGMTRDQARLRLAHFLESCQNRGCVWVLVITGKGQREGSAPSRGILHSLVPQWLEEIALRVLVSGYITAKPRDGGEGALYIRIKRKKSVPTCLL